MELKKTKRNKILVLDTGAEVMLPELCAFMNTQMHFAMAFTLIIGYNELRFTFTRSFVRPVGGSSLELLAAQLHSRNKQQRYFG